MTPEPVRFQRVDDDGGSDPEAPEPDASPIEASGEVREAEQDPYPLAGPILEEARARELRGQCSSCQARLRLRLEPGRSGKVTVRCPICGRTAEVEV